VIAAGALLAAHDSLDFHARRTRTYTDHKGEFFKDHSDKFRVCMAMITANIWRHFSGHLVARITRQPRHVLSHASVRNQQDFTIIEHAFYKGPPTFPFS
jgi:hypothetical protein